MRCIALLSLCLIACSTSAVPQQNNTNDPDGGGTDAGPTPPITLNDGGTNPDSPYNPSTNCEGGCKPTSSTDGIKNEDETDIDCGGTQTPKCASNKHCDVSANCVSALCNYNHTCIVEPSCINHFGGDTCGAGEVGEAGAVHESCCKSLLVSGFNDAKYPGKLVYLDKYEITSGRVRAFIEAITKEMGGKPNVKEWISARRPTVWNADWEVFLPTDNENGVTTINRLLLGDPRHDGQTPEEAGPGVIIPPPTDQVVNLGLNHQFGGQVFADVHGNNCGTYAGAYGFPTYYYSPSIQTKNGEVPRSVGQDMLDVKSMNCITNVMLAAFCAWDGGQLATGDVMDYVTDGPSRTDNVSSCGSQYDNHGDLLGNYFGRTVQTGGRCADVLLVNATFDAGDYLPVPGSFLNKHIYGYPDIPGTSDKAWQIASPGRVSIDMVRMNGAEPWMDLAGNLSESVINNHTGLFGLRFRGIGYGSSRSDLNVTLMPGENILRVQRPEVKSALSGGRCMRFK
jgi:hypothetical protein